MKQVLTIAAIAILAGASPLRAQDMPRKLFVEALAGVAVPTFDIADVANTGGAFGATIDRKSVV